MSHTVLVDWLSFTLSSPDLGRVPRPSWLRKCCSATRAATVAAALPPEVEADFAEFSGRAPYLIRWTSAEFGTTLLAHPALNHMLIEVSGGGCEGLRQRGDMERVLQAVRNRLTRLDLAVDMDANVDPRQFVKEHDKTRFTTTSQFQSRTGITCYVGSAKSERFARVYKYAEPLPRAGTLRAEHVFRAEWARKVGGLILGQGLAAAAQYCGQVWAWTHPAWDVGEPDALITVARELATRHPNQMLWLLTQVFPAMRRMADEGVIADLRGFVEEHLLDPYEEEDN